MAICELCHQAKHSIKCAIRQRDGYVCSECGMTDAEHRGIYQQPLQVHGLRGTCKTEREWVKLGVKHEELFALCTFCHSAKHCVRPSVLRRDKCQCRKCGKKPDDNRLWFNTVAVHRLKGYCHEEVGLNASLDDFVTLCLECHEAEHPDDVAEYLELGFKIDLPRIVKEHGEEFGITLPATGKAQFKRYREYLLLVNFYIDHFRKIGLPKNGRVSKALIRLPETTFSNLLREEAVKEAMQAFDSIFGPTRKEEKAMKKMSGEEKRAFLREKHDRRLDWVMKRNVEPTITVQINQNTFCFASI